MINIDTAKEIFNNYVKSYDLDNLRIALKVRHSYRVSEIAKGVADSLDADSNIAELIGLIHDIGRFEQLKQYDSFNDSRTIDHANLGVKILEENNNSLLKKFCPDESMHKTILISVKNHNKFKIENGLSEKEEEQCKIIRDSDKIDILHLSKNKPFQILYKKDDIKNEDISDNVYNAILESKQVLVKDINTNIDSWILHAGLIFDINYKRSFDFVNKDNAVNVILDRIDGGKNRDKVSKMREHINEYIKYAENLYQ